MGNPLWDLFNRETDMLCNSWNKSVRLMLGVPVNTHRYFLEPLSGLKHLKFTLITRFLNFLSQIKKSPKILPNILLKTIERDCRSVTGSNLRNILLLTKKDDISQLVYSDISEFVYMPVPDHEKWRIEMVNELIEVKWGKAAIDNFDEPEINEIMNELCTT